jgi:predicted Zn-dependent peptidase
VGADAELAALAPKTAEPVGADSMHELTWTWACVPEAQIGLALEIERDRLTALAPTAALLDDARSDLLTERLKPETRAWNLLIGLAFPDCSLGRPRLGSPAVVSSVSLANVEAWRKKHFRIDDAVVVVAGVHDATKALALVKEKLGGIAKPAEALPAPPVVSPPPRGPLDATLGGSSIGRHVWLGFRGPEPGGADEAAFLTAIFALKDRIEVGLRGKAREASVHADARTDAPALLVVSASPRPAASLAEIESLSRTAAGIVRTSSPPDLERLKARAEHMLSSLTGPLDPRIQGAKDEPAVLVEVAVERAFASPLVARREVLLKEVKALTPEMFVQHAREFLSEERLYVVRIEPPK